MSQWFHPSCLVSHFGSLLFFFFFLARCLLVLRNIQWVFSWGTRGPGETMETDSVISRRRRSSEHCTSRSQLAVAGGGTDRRLLSVEVKQTCVTQALGIQRDGKKKQKKTVQPVGSLTFSVANRVQSPRELCWMRPQIKILYSETCCLYETAYYTFLLSINYYQIVQKTIIILWLTYGTLFETTTNY